jgi:uncharacterized protein YbbC (DUF1343 family)/CubicO group peptidase (beta-lactamase class C family)
MRSIGWLCIGLIGLASAQGQEDKEVWQPVVARIAAAVAAGETPGAVAGVVRGERLVFNLTLGFMGQRQDQQPVARDTIYDLASLTKPIATATAVMKLVEMGKLKVTDPVAQHLPEFGVHGKERITVAQLLLHTSGLIADNPLADYTQGRAAAIAALMRQKLVAEPGTRFIYSDVGYIVLGLLVEKLSSQPLDRFVTETIFQPLGMTDTGFNPKRELQSRIAPTEVAEDGTVLRGVVHDPRARHLGGVAGHAGLFSTLPDLARFARMMLNGGSLDGVQVLTPATVRAMTEAHAVPGGLRSYGWDVDTGYSRNRGLHFPIGRSFGHTGFTGTSLWLDPGSGTAVIFLSNRTFPDGKGNVNVLRGEVATLAAAALGISAPGPVLPGLDVLKAEGFARLKGRKVGVITNHTGRDQLGYSIIDLLHQTPDVALVAIFTPEHGLRGQLDEPVPDGKDPRTGRPVYSLYGQRRKPTAEQLRGIDTLLFDIQDIGCRFYTYISTLGLCLEAAAENRIKFMVLDRPNPIGGTIVEGPMLDAGKESFVGYHRLPLRHGMTVGELALLFKQERRLDVDLDIVKVRGWRRHQRCDETGLMWLPPSPNMRTLTAALLYPGIGLLETTNVSVGRGTDRPFEILGAPWIDGRRLAAALNARRLAGVRFVATTFVPTSSTHAGKRCEGVQIFVLDDRDFASVPVGLAVAQELRRHFAADWELRNYDRLLGSAKTFQAVADLQPLESIVAAWAADMAAFRAARQPHLLYD